MENPKTQAVDPELSEAMETACAVVRQRWPEFADVQPQVTQRALQTLDPSDASRLGVGRAAYIPQDHEYTFTFARETRTPEGYTIPRVARITVDSRQQVLKAVVSK